MRGFRELVNQGYIHRDIKPENALCKGNLYKVADFGFATRADVSNKVLLREFCGTPLYMAPQLIQQQPYTSKSDVWSIGVMFFEMLFGKMPWVFKNGLKLVYERLLELFMGRFEHPIEVPV